MAGGNNAARGNTKRRTKIMAVGLAAGFSLLGGTYALLPGEQMASIKNEFAYAIGAKDRPASECLERPPDGVVAREPAPLGCEWANK